MRWIFAAVLVGAFAWIVWWDHQNPYACLASHRETVTRCLKPAGYGGCYLWGEPKVEEVCDVNGRRPRKEIP